VFDPLTRYPCCPPTCGAAAAVLCSDDFARKHGISRPVYIAAQAMTTDFATTFDEKSMIKMVGYDMAKACAKKVYEKAGLGPSDVDVVELHDCFTANELLTYEALGLCPEGGAEKFIWDGDNTYGGKSSPTRRAAVEGPPARRDRPRTVHRARVAPARSGRSTAGRRREDRAAAQPRPRRRVRRHDVPARLIAFVTPRCTSSCSPQVALQVSSRK
jgi:hypothetical protein